jgi:hypothetical protein
LCASAPLPSSAVFKPMKRYGDFLNLLLDLVYCDVFLTHVRYFLDGRKNLQYGCAMMDVYFMLVRGKRSFDTGHVLAHTA